MGQGGTSETTTASPARDERRGPLPVAGVGASAGGLAATSDLLRHLGPRPGIATVIVHHLDPAHESSLVEIFSRITALPVHTVSDGMRVEPDHVYVVPPNAGLAIANGTLGLRPRIEGSGPHHPIDRFFESLAVDRTVHALGVVVWPMVEHEADDALATAAARWAGSSEGSRKSRGTSGARGLLPGPGWVTSWSSCRTAAQ